VIQFDIVNTHKMCRKQGLSANMVIGWKPSFCVHEKADSKYGYLALNPLTEN